MNKILLISNMYPSNRYPHYGIFVKNTVNLLKNGGYTVTVCAMPKCDTFADKIWHYMLLYSKSILLGMFGNYKCVYAHFVSHTAIPVMILKKIYKNLIVVENAHGNDVVADTAQDLKNIERSRQVLKIADWTIVPSDYYKKVVATTFSVPQNRIFVSPSGGVNSTNFEPMDQRKAREKASLNQNCFWIGYISRIETGKGWDTFLQGCTQLVESETIPNLRILIVGSGTEKETMLQLTQKSGLEAYIEYRNFVPQEDLKYYYNALDVFCFPSNRKSESLGLVGLEAMACGTLCVCSDAEGIKTYAENNKNCLMFERENAKQLANQLLAAYKMKEDKKRRIRNNALATASQYSTSNIEKDLLDFFDKKVMLS